MHVAIAAQENRVLPHSIVEACHRLSLRSRMQREHGQYYGSPQHQFSYRLRLFASSSQRRRSRRAAEAL